ncbi:hypothetical protein [Wolbachia endosymbiont (group A) of Scambus nigricans]|uniref:hypothetical protein n=1 Tax=Wolbachia endosymbiont (group A) of Scambus nigricans TaxID=2954055 RepID=UPI00222E5BBA|nr:hypothetical protein [Wolbachia endosymbiont (group A) of Scambus nigricans]
MLLACYSHKHISYRIRTIIRKAINREKELLIKCYLLNKFTDIGMAKFETVT